MQNEIEVIVLVNYLKNPTQFRSHINRLSNDVVKYFESPEHINIHKYLQELAKLDGFNFTKTKICSGSWPKKFPETGLLELPIEIYCICKQKWFRGTITGVLSNNACIIKCQHDNSKRIATVSLTKKPRLLRWIYDNHLPICYSSLIESIKLQFQTQKLSQFIATKPQQISQMCNINQFFLENYNYYLSGNFAMIDGRRVNVTDVICVKYEERKEYCFFIVTDLIYSMKRPEITEEKELDTECMIPQTKLVLKHIFKYQGQTWVGEKRCRVADIFLNEWFIDFTKDYKIKTTCLKFIKKWYFQTFPPNISRQFVSNKTKTIITHKKFNMNQFGHHLLQSFDMITPPIPQDVVPCFYVLYRDGVTPSVRTKKSLDIIQCNVLNISPKVRNAVENLHVIGACDTHIDQTSVNQVFAEEINQFSKGVKVILDGKPQLIKGINLGYIQDFAMQLKMCNQMNPGRKNKDYSQVQSCDKCFITIKEIYTPQKWRPKQLKTDHLIQMIFAKHYINWYGQYVKKYPNLPLHFTEIETIVGELGVKLNLKPQKPWRKVCCAIYDISI